MTVRLPVAIYQSVRLPVAIYQSVRFSEEDLMTVRLSEEGLMTVRLPGANQSVRLPAEGGLNDRQASLVCLPCTVPWCTCPVPTCLYTTLPCTTQYRVYYPSVTTGLGPFWPVTRVRA